MRKKDRTKNHFPHLLLLHLSLPLGVPPLPSRSWCRGMGNGDCGHFIIFHLCCSSLGFLPQDTVPRELLQSGSFHGQQFFTSCFGNTSQSLQRSAHFTTGQWLRHKRSCGHEKVSIFDFMLALYTCYIWWNYEEMCFFKDGLQKYHVFLTLIRQITPSHVMT